MKTILRSLGMILPMVSQTAWCAGARYVAEYEVRQIRPAYMLMGKLRVIHTDDWCVVEFIGGTSEVVAAYSNEGTLVGSGGLKLRSAELLPPHATGRVPFVPIFPEPVLGWDMVRPKALPGRATVFLADVVADSLSPYSEEAKTHSSSFSGKKVIDEIRLVHLGKTSEAWKFEFTVRDGVPILKSLTRRRFKHSGLNIPQDDQYQWKMLSYAKVALNLTDRDVLANHASVILNQKSRVSRIFSYDPTGGSIKAQLAGGKQVALGSSDSPFRLLLVCVAMFGLVTGASASIRFLKRSER